MAKEIRSTEARQGRSGTRVLTILIVGLILAAIVWWGVGIYGSSIEPDDQVGGDPVEQSGEETPTAGPTQPVN